MASKIKDNNSNDNQSILSKQQYGQLEKDLGDAFHYQPKKKKSSIFETGKSIIPNSWSEVQKMSRVISYIDMNKVVTKNAKVQNLMIAYTTMYGGALIASLIIPKKILSKAVISLGLFAIKSQFTDYYVMVESLKLVALSEAMTKDEQEVRNILEYFYERKREMKRMKDAEDPSLKEENPDMLEIKKRTQQYYLYLQNKDLL